MKKVHRSVRPISSSLISGDMRSALEKSVTSNPDAAVAFLRRDFLRVSARQLYNARKAAGLSQAQLAEMLHTTQSVISRTEADLSGSISLKRYVEWLVACQVVPKNLELVPLSLATEVAHQTLSTRYTTSVTVDATEEVVALTQVNQR